MFVRFNKEILIGNRVHRVGEVADIDDVRAGQLIDAGAAVGASGPATYPGRFLRLVNDATINGSEHSAGEVVEIPDWLAPGMIERGDAYPTNGPASRLPSPAKPPRARAR